jgi:hypothetical protein
VQLLPSAGIAKIPLPVYLDSIVVRHADVTYQERVRWHDEPAEIRFSSLQATIAHISNMPERIETEPNLKVRASGLFMGKGELRAEIDIPLADPVHTTFVKASLGSMPLKRLNPSTLTWAGVTFNKGDVLGVQLNFQMNDTIGLGWSDFEYRDLNVKVHKLSGERKSEWLSTILGNLALRKNNRTDKGRYLRGRIHFERPNTTPFFGYIWKCIRSGVVPVAVGDLLRGGVEKSLRKPPD